MSVFYTRLRHDRLDDVALDIRETEIAPGVFESELLVIESQQRENRRVQIVDVHLVLHCLVTVVIRLAVAEPAEDAAAGHPERETFIVVVATVVALRVRGASKLTAP